MGEREPYAVRAQVRPATWVSLLPVTPDLGRGERGHSFTFLGYLFMYLAVLTLGIFSLNCSTRDLQLWRGHS